MTEQLSFTWSSRREGNDGYVLEERSDGTRQEWGPMPPHVVPSFLMMRRHWVHYKMEHLGHKYHDEYLTDAELKLFQ